MKFFILTCFLAIFAPFLARTQGWERAYPTLSPQPEAVALKALPHPNGAGFLVLMTDYEFSVGNFYLVSVGGTGDVQGLQTFDFGGAEAAVDMARTADGGYAVLYDVFYDPLDTVVTHLLRLDAGFNTLFDVSLADVASPGFHRGVRVVENANGLFVFGNNRTPDGYEWATTLRFTAAGGFAGQLNWGPQNSPVRDGLVASDGTLIGLTDQPGASLGVGDRIRVTRFDGTGATVLWEKLLTNVPLWERAGALENALDGNLIVGGSRTGNAVLYKIDLQGNTLWESQTVNEGGVWGIFDLAATPDGGYWAVGQTPTFIPQIYLMRFDGLGQLTRSAQLGPFGLYNFPYHLLALPDNGVLISGSQRNPLPNIFPSPHDPYLWRADSLGRTVATGISGRVQRDTDGNCTAGSDSLGYGPYTVFALQNGAKIDSVSVNADGFYDLAVPPGTYQVTVKRPSNAWTLCPDTLTATVPPGGFADDQNFVIWYNPQPIDSVYGFVFIDYDGDCVKDAFEPGLENADVQLVLGHPDLTIQPVITLNLTSAPGGTFFTTNTALTTDLLESLATLQPSPANPQQCDQVCKNVEYLEMPDSRAYRVMFGMQCEPLPPCPVMETQIATASLRPCFASDYSVQVCNYGAATAQNVGVDVTFDPALQITGASIPWSSVNGDTYTFEFDTLPTGGCINFAVDVFVPCTEPTGKTYCAEAHAYPDTSCTAPGANWDGAEIEVSAGCVDTTVVFTIENVGTGNMAAPLDYIVIEDNVLLMQQPGTFQLAAGQQLTLPFTSQGQFLRLEADQSPGFPGLSLPVAWVEGCGASAGNPPVYGFVNQYPVDDPEPWLDVFCLQSTNSYDPNDKTGFPLGYGAARYIDLGQPIEYLIRFQNTGTAPAVNVEIRDTLPWQWLDPTTVRPGPSSHPYEFDIQGNGVVVFKFPNINLPDSVNNEPESHGFVTFSVEQKPGVPLETPVHNTAAIYFDFNAPVITNQTLHTIGQNFILIAVDEPRPAGSVRVTAAPNPAMDRVRFTVAGVPEGQEIVVTLYSALGVPVRTVTGLAPGQEMPVADLMAGLYWFEVRRGEVVIGKGKLVKTMR